MAAHGRDSKSEPVESCERRILVKAIYEYIAHHNTNPKSFIWTKSARDILQKVICANNRLGAKQNATRHSRTGVAPPGAAAGARVRLLPP